MDAKTKARFEAAGWTVGSAQAFLGISDAYMALIWEGASPEELGRAALRAVDPNWSGKGLEYVKPVEVTTLSGRSPVDLVLERRYAAMQTPESKAGASLCSQPPQRTSAARW